jgi:hypothetical protein
MPNRLTSGPTLTTPCTALSVPLTTKTPGIEGYVADHPTGIVEFCDTCRTFWPAATLTFDAATGGLICPACGTADSEPAAPGPARPALAATLTNDQQTLIQQATPDIPGDARWLRFPAFCDLASYRALNDLVDLGIAYRSSDEFLLTAAGRTIHHYLNTSVVNA